MAQVYMFTEELGKAVKSCKCHSVNKIFSSEDKKKVEKGWDRTGEKEKKRKKKREIR